MSQRPISVGTLAVVAAAAWLGLSTHRSAADDNPQREGELLSNVRQLTFEGRRAGEGYFNTDGTRMVFQSERDPANPFYQIYLMDLETGDISKISPGQGKTTCAWIHPDGDRVLYSSTQEDPESVAKQKEELEMRASGTQRRYAWDYDENFDLFAKDLKTGQYTRLTDEQGYDAEGSYSPDGSKIAFASNRAAYARDLSERERQLFEVDKAFMNDIYIMDADGSNVRQLTDVPGYDGGPFFSPDGQRICWRRFSEDGATAEVYTMKVDGTDVRRLTEINAMSWAPYFHPSGDYLIFTTNKHGFGNFELYLVRADGEGEPVRVTYTDGFDGLPVFLADGERLSWTTNRTPQKQSQIFMADWNDAEARRLLGLDGQSDSSDRNAAIAAAEMSTPEFSPTDVMRHVDYLTRTELGGRMTGSEGERKATAYVAAYLESLGFEAAGEDGTFFQNFDFPAGSALTDDNRLVVDGETLKLDTDWRPLAFSKTGPTEAAEVAFAGYGMQVPKSDTTEEYDSYVHLDVAGKWVVVFRDLPQDITAEQRQQLARYSSPRRKATVARDLGARGIIFVAGPSSKVSRQLIRFSQDASQASVSIAAVSVTNEVAAKMFKDSGKDLSKLQSQLDDGSLSMGFQLEGVEVSATIGIERKRGTGRNVIARLSPESASPDAPVLILGAHIDHLGRGGTGGSLAQDDEREKIHVGADDNASGVAAMLEIAQYLAVETRAGRLQPKRDLIVAGWSGEELGLFGSQAYAEAFYDLYPSAPGSPKANLHHGGNPHAANPHAANPHAANPHATNPHAANPHAANPDADHSNAANPNPSNPHAANPHAASAQSHGGSPAAKQLTPAVAAYLNLDMVGRLREKLVVQGIGSSPGFEADVQRRNVPVGLQLQLDRTSTRLPTDASSFVGRGVPVLSGFTGAHEDYHTPRDTPDKLNYEGASKIARLFALIARGILTADQPPKFELSEGEQQESVPRARLTAYLGTIPDYVAGDVKGLKLSGVASDGPAAKAGAQGGDVITELAGRKIEDIYDYTYAIEALKIGEEIDMVVNRNGKEVTLKVIPGSRD